MQSCMSRLSISSFFCPLHIYMCFVRLLSLQSLQFPFDNLIRHVCASLNKAAMQGKEIVILRKFIDFLAEVTVPFTFSGNIKSEFWKSIKCRNGQNSVLILVIQRPQIVNLASYKQWHDAKKRWTQMCVVWLRFFVGAIKQCLLTECTKKNHRAPLCRALKPKPHSLKTITFTGVDHFIPACRPPQIIYSVN